MSITDLLNVNTESNRGPSFERFKMDKLEKARILVPSPKIAQFYTHVFHNDVPVQKEMPNGRTRNVWDTKSFSGMYICTGNTEVVSKNPRYGDPENCASCASLHDPDKAQLIEPAKKTFALNVIRYTTNTGTYDVRNRNISVEVWKHGDVNKLQPIQLAASQTDLSKIDFLIEADNSEWKKLQINYTLDGAAYLKDEKLKQAVEEAIENDLYDEEVLTNACGRKVSAEEMQAEVTALFKQFETAHGASSDKEEDAEGFETSDNGLEDVEINELSSLLDD
ncbi:MAG: hypothetical protein NWE76_01375 [Candidatus Bathyarchaeota archaeon]|nr:hypothetical protein [Candidatus Bathyarchaeota archaeon]